MRLIGRAVIRALGKLQTDEIATVGEVTQRGCMFFDTMSTPTPAQRL